MGERRRRSRAHSLVVIAFASALVACSTARPPATTTATTAPLRIVAADPRRDSDAAIALYRTGLAALAHARDAIAADGALLRCVGEAATIALVAPWSTLQHELGHWRAIDRLGGEPRLQWLGWDRARVVADFAPGTVLTPADAREIAGAGIAQSTLAAGDGYRAWAQRGRAHPAEALGLLLAATDLPRYAERTLRRREHLAADPGDNDVVAYARTAGSRVDERELFWLGAASTALSAPCWAAAAGQLAWIADDDRAVAMPTVSIAGREIALPQFEVLLARDGPIVGGRTLLGTDTATPLEVRCDWRWQATTASLGLRWCDLPVGERFAVSPLLRATATDARIHGGAVGADVEYLASTTARLGLGACWRRRDLVSESEGRFDGTDLHVWFTLLW